MKFKLHDKIKVKDSGKTGTIIGSSFNSVFQDDEYVVIWHGGLFQESYPASEADNSWEIYEPTYMHTDKDTNIVYCNAFNHEWIDVGFHFTKEVCRKCNRDKDNS